MQQASFRVLSLGSLWLMAANGATINNWSSASSTLWGVSANWGSGAPTSTEIVNFGTFSSVLNPVLDSAAGNVTVAGLTISSGYNLTLQKSLTISGASGFVNSGTLTLDAGSTASKISNGGTNSGTIQFASTANSSTKLTITGTLNNAGGTISTANSGAGGITLTGATISGGSITGNGTITVTSSSTLSGVSNSANINFGSSAIKASLSGITNSGTIDFVTATLSGNINNSGGTLQSGGGGVTLSSASLSGGSFLGGGSTISSATSSLNTFNDVAVSNATLKVTSGTTTLSGGTSIGSDVSLQLTGGALNISGPVTLASGLSQTAGTLTLAGTINNGNEILISGGTLSVSSAGATISGGSIQDLASSGKTTISGTGTLSFVGVTGTIGGTMSNSANLSFDSTSTVNITGTLTNSGTITSATSGSFQLSGGTINGGTLSGSIAGEGGDGLFTLNGVTIASNSTIYDNGTLLQLKGTVTNNGTLNGNVNGIGLEGATVIGGTLTGEIYDETRSALSGVTFQNATLALQSSTLSGVNVMNGGTNFGFTTVSGAGSSLTLSGVIQNTAVENGTTVTGVFTAKAGAVLTLSTVNLTGGTLQGTISTAANANNTLSQLESLGTMTISGGSTTTLSGSDTNLYFSEGNVNVTGANSALHLNGVVANDATMTSSNGGSIVLDSVIVTWTAAPGTLSGTIVDAANSTNQLDSVELDGSVTISQGLTWFDGTVDSGMLNNANVTITGQGQAVFFGMTTNNGTISQTGTGLFRMEGATISGGTVNGSVETLGNTVNQILNATGALGDVTVVGGSTLEYGGSLTNSSTITLGDDTDTDSLTIDGDFAQLSAGELNIEGASELDVDGIATLGGTLEIFLQPGFDPSPGAEWEILSAIGGVSGTFDSVILPGSEYSIDYESNAVDVIFESNVAPEPGAWMLAAFGVCLFLAGKWGKALRLSPARIRRR